MSEENKSETTITLDEKINMDNIDKLFLQFSDVDSKVVKQVIIDAEDVEDIDFVGLQTIVSFLKTMENANISVEWDNLPIAIYQAATDIGFCEHLNL